LNGIAALSVQNLFCHSFRAKIYFAALSVQKFILPLFPCKIYFAALSVQKFIFDLKSRFICQKISS